MSNPSLSETLRSLSSRRFPFFHKEERSLSRTIVINRPAENHGFPDNAVRTAKYNWLNLLPKALLEQFRRASNFYFLIVAIVTFIPDISPSSPITAVLPLLVVVGFGFARDVYEDFGRQRLDRKTNSTETVVLRSEHHSTPNVDQYNEVEEFLRRSKLEKSNHVVVPRRDIGVGDITLVRRGEIFPADLLLLYTSNEGGIAYVSTANLDGESNLKRRMAPRESMDLIKGPADLVKLEGRVIAQNPHPALHQFDASLKMQSVSPTSLDQSNLLLRGSVLRNTDYVYGLVVYSGEETKVVLNMRDPPSKLGGIERMLNLVVLFLFSSLMAVVIVASIISGIVQGRSGDGHWYLGSKASISGVSQGFRSVGTYIILFHTFIPISLFVTLEFVRVIQGWFMEVDVKMKSKNTRINVKANNLNDTLGTVEQILSDKTGTLTENVMRYVACSAGGTIHDVRADQDVMFTQVKSDNAAVKRLLLAMALCHSVVAEAKSEYGNGSGEYDLDYQGQSPDEVALVGAAREFGVELRARRLDRISIREFSEEESEYFQLAELQFSSERRRMSVILRCPDGRIRMFTKGADSVMLPLLLDGPYSGSVQEHVDAFALDGLRTLVYGERDFTEDQYKDWVSRYHAASNLLEGRQEAQAALAAEVEVDLNYLGTTAVEDQLQDQVPETIHFLKEAGLKLWVLTGDKRETAENIGYSARLLDRNMRVVHVEVSTITDCRQALNGLQAELRATGVGGGRAVLLPSETDLAATTLPQQGTFIRRYSRGRDDYAGYALIIDGESLDLATSDELWESFMNITALCRSVICCRVTPLQKAQMVKLVKRFCSATTLAIGDGGNDVSMIQEAHVGVGIVGKEGSQAARAADYSIAEFKHLRRLLTVHGRYSYIRTTKVINLSFYKNIFFTLTQVLFQFFAFWSGTTFHHQWMVTVFNAVITLFVPFFLGIFEKDLEESTLYSFPKVYKTNWKNRLFSLKTVAEFTLISSLWHALCVFFGVYLGIGTRIPFVGGRDGGFYFSGLSTTILVISIVLFKFFLCSHILNIFVIGGLIFSFAVLFALIPIFIRLAGAYELNGVINMLLRSPAFWFTWVVVSCFAMIPDFAILAHRALRPDSGLVLRLQKWESANNQSVEQGGEP